ncbi:hypothetical protein IJ579_00845, partial [bacterium]|nr:hypothetical protein [bacterium]
MTNLRTKVVDFVRQKSTLQFTKTPPRPEHHLSGDKCRLGLLPQHVKFPSPIAGEGRISMRKLSIRNSGEGATHT